MKIKVDFSVTEAGKSAPNWVLESDLKGERTIEEILTFTKLALIQISKDALLEEQARGFDKDPIIIVDDSFYKRVEDVDPLGKIEYVSRKVTPKEILSGVYEKIISMSPVDSGFYRDQHLVTHRGEQVASSLEEYNRWLETATIEPGDIVRFINFAPYARKLERYGTIAGRRRATVKKYRRKPRRNYPQEIFRPNGVYYLLFNYLRRRFGKNVPVFFGYLAVDQADVDEELPVVNYRGQRLRTTYSEKGLFGRYSAGRSYLYPSVSLKFGRGVTFE